MDPVIKAVWYIESHFAGAVALDDIAEVAGLSRFALLRAFGTATGRSVMRYVRERRLTEAAKALAAGAEDILSVALEAGYGSHEAFSRAFRDQFGLTPESVRAQRSLDNLPLVETLKMAQSLNVKLDPPRFENGKPMLLAGMMERYNYETVSGIPALWQRFNRHFGTIPGQVGKVAYGVCNNFDDDGNLDYMAAAEVKSFDGLPKEFARLRLAAQRYAVFVHRGHVSKIRGTFHAILSEWMPKSGHEVADAPDFERYAEDFDPRTGNGGIEICIPLKK
jgi:AraC family transcriptional regulator